MEKKGTLLGFCIKAIVSIALLSFFLSRLDPGQFLRLFSSVRLSYLLPAFVAYLFGKLACAIRWALLARPLGFANPLRDFVSYYYIGMFFNLFSPSSLGGDAGKIFYLARGGAEKTEQGRAEIATFALVSVLADRAFGMAGLVWIGAGALMAFGDYAPLVPAGVRYATYILAAAPLVGWLLFPSGEKILRKFDYSLFKKSLSVGRAYWDRPAVLLQCAALSLVFHLIQIWIQVLIGQALRFDIPSSYVFVFFPLVDIVAMLPVSISGVGLREGGFLFFLSKLGVAPEKAVACGTLWFAVVIVSGLAGGILFVLYRRSFPAAPFENRDLRV